MMNDYVHLTLHRLNGAIVEQRLCRTQEIKVAGKALSSSRGATKSRRGRKATIR